MVSQMHKENTLFHSLDTIDKSLQFRDHILSTESPPTSNHHHSIENRKKSDPIDGISWANSTIPVLTLSTFIDPDSVLPVLFLSCFVYLFVDVPMIQISFFFCKISNVSVVGCIVFLFSSWRVRYPCSCYFNWRTRGLFHLCIVSTFIPHTKSVNIKRNNKNFSGKQEKKLLAALLWLHSALVEFSKVIKRCKHRGKKRPLQSNIATKIVNEKVEPSVHKIKEWY